MLAGRILFVSVRRSYSGRIAAESFAHMQGMEVDRVIVLGPCHRYYTRFLCRNQLIRSYCMLTGASKLETPCGTLDVDVDAQKKLNESVDYVPSFSFVGHLQSL